jgi:SAM-dependent methyltransferase
VTAVSPSPACLRAPDGSLDREGESWVMPVTPADHDALRRAPAPVLDIGCGPGRHVIALAELGVPALGIDITPIALHAARAGGALVLRRSVFDRLPGAGRWGGALLLDGNVGIGGDPALLLRRVLRLLRPGGLLVVELDAPSVKLPVRTVRLEVAGRAGPWFRWATVPADDVAALAAQVGAEVEETWRAGGDRWFATLRRPA